MAVVVLGMHRSGTSCVAGMLAAGGIAATGDAVRNWDNARGHHEMLDAVRLNEAVLAHSGGHWLSPPAEVRWTPAHAEARDRLLQLTVDGRPALLKDPRTLLVLRFWRASAIPFHVVGVVRHPLAVARSLESWREMPLGEGVALWIAHAEALLDDHARHPYTLVDFDGSAAAVTSAVAAAATAIGGDFDAAALRGAYEDRLVHHDATDTAIVAGLDVALELHARLAAACHGARRLEPLAANRTTFPRAHVARFHAALRAGEREAALVAARDAIAATTDAGAVLVPIVTALVRAHALADAARLIEEQTPRLDDLADLLLGKVLLASGDSAAAIRHLEAACARPDAFFQARQLLAHALRAAGRKAEARAAIAHVAREALYPHGPLATLAEWSLLDGDRTAAIADMARAIDVAPLYRRGRLRTRRAEWLIAEGELVAARTELERAIAEDPGYARSRDVLASLP